MKDTGFACCADRSARILILGSMPGQASLAAHEYYAHPANAFWPIMEQLFDIAAALPYAQRLQRLKQQHIALWDVAHQCIRPGSMDHHIRLDSVVANDFATLFATHPHIRAIFFNGRKAEELYRRLVLPNLPDAYRALPRQTLPSTSPAHARMNFAQKLQVWKKIRLPLEKD